MRAVSALIALELAGCGYGLASLPQLSTGSYDARELPRDARAEAARRHARRWWALAGSAVEVGLGVLARVLASHADERGASVLRGAGEGFVMFAAGDVVLALGDTFASTPFVDEAGRFQPPEHFDSPAVAPSERWQIDAGVGVSVASQRRTETHYDVAVFRWLSPTLRMRYQLGADHGIDFSGDSTETYYGIGGGAQLEWNPGRRRRHFGRHPHSALFALVLPRALLGEHRDAAFGWRASVGWELGPMMIGAGATQIVGDDRLPGGEVWFAIRPVATD